MIKKQDVCTDTIDYSYTSCLFEYIQDTIQCKINWNLTTNDPLQCPMDFDLKEYLDLLLFLQHSSIKNITEVTGCLPKCKYTYYKYKEQENEIIDWKTDWISSFYLMPTSSDITKAAEQYEYGVSDLFSDFGSYLGLFLGWSLLSISNDIPRWFKRMQDCFKKVFGKSKLPQL